MARRDPRERSAAFVGQMLGRGGPRAEEEESAAWGPEAQRPVRAHLWCGGAALMVSTGSSAPPAGPALHFGPLSLFHGV